MSRIFSFCDHLRVSISCSRNFVLSIAIMGTICGVMVVAVPIIAATSTDQYGGYTAVSCPNGPQSHFYTQKIGNRWWLCDPAGHGFFFRGIQNIGGDVDARYNDIVTSPAQCWQVGAPPAEGCTGPGTCPNCASKYANITIANPYVTASTISSGIVAHYNWLLVQISRMKSWGLNGTSDNTEADFYPTYTDNNWTTSDRTLPASYKIPFVWERAGGITTYVYNNSNGCGLPSAPKEIGAGLANPNFNYYSIYHPDLFQPGYGTCIANIINAGATPGSVNTGYLVAIVIDESGQFNPVNVGPDFTRIINNVIGGYGAAPYSSWEILTTKPSQTAGSDYELYSKVKMADLLLSEYSGIPNSSIDPSCVGSPLPSYCMGDTYPGATAMTNAKNALNTAWGSSYASLSTSDANCTSNLHTCLSTGTYASWGINTNRGLLDENGTWSGIGDACTLGNNSSVGACGSPGIGSTYAAETAAMQTDMSAIEKAYLDQYFSTLQAPWAAANLGVILGAEVGGWGAPPHHEVLSEMKKYGIMPILTYPEYCSNCTDIQQRLDYTYTWYGDTAYLTQANWSAANPDSAVAYNPNGAQQVANTQNGRGQVYINTTNSLLSAGYSVNGAHPVVGWSQWGAIDDDREQNNWGPISANDNPYDGVCATAASSTDVYGLSCGERLLDNTICRGANNPLTECTGSQTGTVPHITPETYACTGAGTPYACCTGVKTGSCTMNYGNFTGAVTTANASVDATLTGVSSTPLSASFSAFPTSGSAPLVVSFTGSASGGTPPYTYSWNFGDGTTTSTQNPSHTYSAPGTYTATLTVTDSASNTATASQTIMVSSTADTTPPTVSITSPANGSSYTVGTSIAVNVSASDNVGVVKTNLLVDGFVIATSTASPWGFTWNTTGASAATHTLMVKAYDAAGNVGTSASVSVTLTTGTTSTSTPMAWYKFDDGSGTSALDSSGNNFTASLQGSTLPVWTTGCELNGCLSFNGASSYVITPTLTPPTNVTLAVWIKPNTAGGVVFSELGQSTINTSYHVSNLEVETTGVVKACLYNSGTVCVTAGTLTFGAWHHVVMRYDASVSTLTGFLDGVQGGSVTTGKQWPVTLYYGIGATDSTNGGNGNYFSGLIDDARVYNNALSNSQIASLATTSLSASATASPTSGTAPLTVSFTGSASGGAFPYSYSWNFGDGSAISIAQNPSHTYSSTGTYTATLTVTDGASKTATASQTITVSNQIMIGSRVKATANLNVRKQHCTTGKLVGIESSGSLGTVIGGPNTSCGYTWWQINWDDGLSGWSIQDYLALASTALAPATTSFLSLQMNSSPSVSNNNAAGIASLIQELQAVVQALEEQLRRMGR